MLFRNLIYARRNVLDLPSEDKEQGVELKGLSVLNTAPKFTGRQKGKFKYGLIVF